MSGFMSGEGRTDNYWEAVKALERLLETDGLDSAERASAEALADQIKASYLSGGVPERYHGHPNVYKESSGSTCMARLIKGGRCPHAEPFKSSGLPHELPQHDHSSLLLENGKPVARVDHFYSLSWESIKELVAFCSEYNLQLEIKPASWHFPNRTICTWIEKVSV